MTITHWHQGTLEEANTLSSSSSRLAKLESTSGTMAGRPKACMEPMEHALATTALTLKDRRLIMIWLLPSVTGAIKQMKHHRLGILCLQLVYEYILEVLSGMTCTPLLVFKEVQMQSTNQRSANWVADDWRTKKRSVLPAFVFFLKLNIVERSAAFIYQPRQGWTFKRNRSTTAVRHLEKNPFCREGGWNIHFDPMRRLLIAPLSKLWRPVQQTTTNIDPQAGHHLESGHFFAIAMLLVFDSHNYLTFSGRSQRRSSMISRTANMNGQLEAMSNVRNQHAKGLCFRSGESNSNQELSTNY